MPADPRRVKELFAAALEVTDAQARQAFLERACAGDVELHQRLQALLHAHDQPQPALDQPLVGVAPVEGNQTGPYGGSADGAIEEQPGAVLAGKYKLLEQIGEGGMGSVWMAQQTEPVKRMVAVKLIKSGADSNAVLVRFEAERQALALMDHPNIARVLDAGTTQRGSPFFVMELVKGVPITRFCDARKLTPRQRLELFVPVCQAIQHAHQKGIIHRDVKPSNVLIALYDDRPVPKVIDFGVAKATGTQLTEQTLHTGFGSIVGTLEYMSPEQATLNNLDIDTRSDIYSLGVLLYELLAGGVPFRSKDLEKAGMLEMLRVIREEEPPKPSTRASSADGLSSLAANRGMEPAKLTRQLRGEIDWMVMKALEKERSRRYETANGMAMDIQRYLADEPVSAGPPSTADRLKKFVKRNKGPVLAAIVVLLVLVGGIAGTTWGLVRADMARQAERQQRTVAEEKQREAEEQKERAQKAEKETLEDYRASTDDAIEQLIGSRPVLGPQEKIYLEKTLKRWQAFAKRTGNDQRSRAIQAEGQYRVALLQAKLRQTTDAVAGFSEALTVYEKLAEDFPTEPAYRQHLAGMHNNLGVLREGLNLGEQSAQHYRKALAIWEKLAGDFPAVPAYHNDLAAMYNNVGLRLAEGKQWDEAAKHYQAALVITQKLANTFPTVVACRRELARTHNNLGHLLAVRKEWAKAAEQHHKALLFRQKLADDFPGLPEYRQDVAISHNNLGLLLAEQKEWEKAQRQYREAIAIMQKLAERFPAAVDYGFRLGGSCYNYGRMLRQWGKPAESLIWYGKAIRIFTRRHEEDPRLSPARTFLRNSHDGRAQTYDQLEKHAEAVKDWTRAIELSPPKEQSWYRYRRADSLVRAGRVAEAVAEVAELSKSTSVTAVQCYDFACVYAMASGKATDKKTEYADRAMELLHKAVQGGFRDAAHLAKDKDLDALRGRDDFKKLLADLKTTGRPEKIKEPLPG